MKHLISFYKGVGRQTQKMDNIRPGRFLMQKHPFIEQTPGRHQYYKAENEPFIPGKFDHPVKMCFREHQVGHSHAN